MKKVNKEIEYSKPILRDFEHEMSVKHQKKKLQKKL